MADYFDTDATVRDYDSTIMRRILACLAPYKLLTALALVSSLISTLGMLFVPVLTQRVIDDAVMAKYLAVDLGVFEDHKQDLSRGSRDFVEKMQESGSKAAGALCFVAQNQSLHIASGIEKELREREVITPDEWYAFSPLDSYKAFNMLALEHPELFLVGDGFAAIKRADLDALPAESRRLIRAGDIRYIINAVILLFFVLVAVFVFTYLQVWSTTLIGQKVMLDIRMELFSKTVCQSTAFLSRHPVGRLVTRLTGDVETINEFFTSVLAAFLKDLFVMAGVLITLFVLSPELALMSLITLPFVLVVTAVSRIKARDAFRRQRTAASSVSSYLSERLSGVQVVQLFLRENKSAQEFRLRNRELLAANISEIHVFATFRPIIEWLAVLASAIIIVAGGALVLNLSVSIGVLIAFISLIGMFYNPMTDIAEKYTLLQSAMAGGERVFSLMDVQEYIPNHGKKAVPSTTGHIVFDAVHFSYNKDEEVLKGLSFEVKQGEMAAIVGYTGAGKTTITNVLARLWDIDSGSILLDGTPITDIPLDTLRKAVLPVLQEVFLFSGTVADNIRLSLPLSDAQVEDAARIVHAHEFISRMKDGYQTQLSEGATNISSGQRQLLSFARVVAHNPAIVILDEATSSIDTETERLIQLGLEQVLKGRTSIVIAHRLSTIRNANRIFVLSEGKVAEQGTHHELIAQNGLYAMLYKLQYSSDSEI
ncbi:ABC transporter ATP-binding protein [Breznakiellaceae bacterium SP9]